MKSLTRIFARYFKAFRVALRMTLRGEKPALSQHTDLVTWMNEAQRLTTAAFQAADQDGINEQARRNFSLKIDGRSITMQTILDGIAYHLTHEYPYLLRDETRYSLVAIYSSNVNDRYRAERLTEALDQPRTRAAVAALTQHLASIPPANFPITLVEDMSPSVIP